MIKAQLEKRKQEKENLLAMNQAASHEQTAQPQAIPQPSPAPALLQPK